MDSGLIIYRGDSDGPEIVGKGFVISGINDQLQLKLL